SRMISAAPFFRYVNCSSTGLKADMRKDIIRNRGLKLTPKVQIRKARIEDVPRLRRIIEASVRGLQAGDYSPAQIEGALASVYGVDSQLIADGTYLVAEIDEAISREKTIVACGGWSKRKTLYGGDQYAGREDSLLDPARDAAKIRAFFVHPEWARQGIG